MIGLATEYVLARQTSFFRLYRSDRSWQAGWEGAAMLGLGGLQCPQAMMGATRKTEWGKKETR